MKIRQTILALTFAVSGAMRPAVAADDFYKGKTISLIVGANPGAGYDAMARLLARHMGKHIPGNPTIIVQNMPGGGGMMATNRLFNVAEKNGTEIGLFNRATLFAPLLGEDVAKYKVEEFNWLGSPASYTNNAYVFMIRASLPYRTFDDLRRADPPLNVGSENSVINAIIKEALGVRMKLVRGYISGELDVAFERNEINAMGTSYANLTGFKPDWLTDHFVRIMTQFGSGKRLPELADVPTARELATNDDDRALIEFSEGSLTLGFPIAAPPGTPPDRVADLRKAFQATMDDPEFRKDGEQAKLEYSPRDGNALQAAILKFANTPPGVRARYKKILAEND